MYKTSNFETCSRQVQILCEKQAVLHDFDGSMQAVPLIRMVLRKHGSSRHALHDECLHALLDLVYCSGATAATQRCCILWQTKLPNFDG